MSMMSSLLKAVEKGYRFDENDRVIGLHGKPLSLRINSCGYPKFTLRNKVEGDVENRNCTCSQI